MANHLYRVGQTVDFNPSMRSGVPASGRAYKIVKLLPYERRVYVPNQNNRRALRARRQRKRTRNFNRQSIASTGKA
jgi:hypothetical protein